MPLARFDTRCVASASAAALIAWACPTQAGAPRYHDGLYLRLGGGLGHLSSSAESETVLGNPVEANVTTLAVLGELGLGGTVADGDHQVQVHVTEFVRGLAAVCRDVDPQLGHRAYRKRMDIAGRPGAR